MKKIPLFAVLKFTCVACKEPQELDVTETPENKHNYDCECTQKYLINRQKCKVITIGDINDKS